MSLEEGRKSEAGPLRSQKRHLQFSCSHVPFSYPFVCSSISQRHSNGMSSCLSRMKTRWRYGRLQHMFAGSLGRVPKSWQYHTLTKTTICANDNQGYLKALEPARSLFESGVCTYSLCQSATGSHTCVPLVVVIHLAVPPATHPSPSLTLPPTLQLCHLP